VQKKRHWRDNPSGAQEEVCRLKDVERMLEVVIGIASTIELAKVLQEGRYLCYVKGNSI
jgi:hypothetical protein